MTQLLIKQTSWWGAHQKHMALWLPVATLQAGTLAGLGYTWQRLLLLEQSQRDTGMTSVGWVNRDAASFGSELSTLHLPPASALAATLVPQAAAVRAASVVMPSSAAPRLIQPEWVSITPSVIPPPLSNLHESAAIPSTPVSPQKVLASVHIAPKPVSEHKALMPTIKHASIQSSVSNVYIRKQRKAKQLPQPMTVREVNTKVRANKALLSVPTKTLVTALPVATLPPVTREDLSGKQQVVTADLTPKKASTVPVGSRVWIYIGELRDYGWYGQKLHIAPNSGLPQSGQSYLTQQIHGYFDMPHGVRSMGGFQQGDKVLVLRVIQETNGGVWAQVLKQQSVGRND